jgi:hypothetical protein
MESDVKKPSVANHPPSASSADVRLDPQEDLRRRNEQEKLLRKFHKMVNGPNGSGGVLDPDHRGGSIG